MTHKIDAQCPTCGNTRKLRPGDASRAKQCRKCHTSAAGKKGYAVTVARHGQHFGLGKLQEYRLANPSSLEVIVEAALNYLGIPYRREAIFIEETTGFGGLNDFELADGSVIEVNGTWVHAQNPDRDARKMAALEADGRRVLVLSETAVTGDNLKSVLSRFARGH